MILVIGLYSEIDPSLAFTVRGEMMESKLDLPTELFIHYMAGNLALLQHEYRKRRGLPDVQKWNSKEIQDRVSLLEVVPKESRVEALNKTIQLLKIETGQISDGYHTFDELYEHRIELYLKLAEMMYWSTRDNSIKRDTVWCSKLHSDGSSIEGWFVLGINQKPGEQISYHLPMKYWERACRHVVKVLDRAPEFDGHSSADVLERLRKL